ncbi:MAG: DNA polymerase III subunit gamma/tau, partial [Desulfitobacterium sp.]|nr:DNA polymerase III subunit gamma/tau [Desulfitobacterium sp.]
MAYLALYREWRPTKFQEMVGQEHVTKTLANAIQQGKVAHAYLFSGPRGTGKTTAAKIMAKALNCEQLTGAEPCNECSSCLSINQGNAMEVMEIDAASNRGIDEIRDLREKVRLSAGERRYKVYIIDEVHMLTTEAFNALLKTLEEPPERVIFILATTEVHKIPLTILSRVQRFEFHRISIDKIQSHLEKVCLSIGRDVEPEAIQIIAQKSEGGLRDALSILDQCLLLDGKLGVKQVYQVLGMVGEEFCAKLVDRLIVQDYAQTLEHLAEGINQGMDPRQVIRELLDYLRQGLLYIATSQFTQTAPHLQEKLVEQCQQIGLKKILKWISILLQGEGQLKFATNARLAAELLLVQVIYDSNENTSEDIAEVSQKLQELEDNIKNLSMISTQEKYPIKNKRSSQVNYHTQENTFLDQVKAPLNKPDKKENLPNKPANDTLKTAPVSQRENRGLTLEVIENRWPEVLEEVNKIKKSTHAFLMEGRPCELTGNKLVIVFKDGLSFHKDKVNQKENKETIEKVLENIFGSSLQLSSILES